MASGSQVVPRTPRYGQPHARPPPTPDSRDVSASGRITVFNPHGKSLSDASPTPSRFKNAVLEGTRNDDLAARVLRFLQSSNVELHRSAELHSCRMIRSDVDLYETKLRRAEQDILELDQKLRETEGGQRSSSL